MKHTQGKQPEDYMKESFARALLEKTENPTWLNIVWTNVIHWYAGTYERLSDFNKGV